MSHKNFKTLHPRSIYQGVEFQEEPYATTEKFNIYLPKEKDFVKELVDKDKKNNMKTSSHYDFNQYASQSGALLKEGQTQKFLTDKEELNQDGQQYIEQQNQESRLRQKLRNDLNTANELITEPPQHFHSPQLQRSILKKHQAQRSTKIQQGFRTSTDFSKNLVREKELRRLRESLYFDERTKTVPKSTIRNNIIEDIVKDGDVIVKKKDLADAIYKLKELQLLKNHDLNVKQFPGVGKIGFVYNDYHSKSTNNGFSRNFGGVFFTR